jgi:gamma-glutamyltranspeptidase
MSNMLATGKQGVITTPHPAATEAGAAALKDGGSAIDAMIAASATLAAVYPHMTGIGGDALWLLNDGRIRTIMGYGQAGQALPSGGITQRGPGAVATTAAALASWQTALNISRHEWHSSLTLPRLLEHSIHWARTGSAVSESQSFWIKQRKQLLATLPDLAPLCRNPDGSFLDTGDIMVQSQLGNSLEQLAKRGINDFYQGELAHALYSGFQQLECGLTLADLAATRAPEVEPIRVPYRNGYFYNFPPPSQGLYTAKAMATLNQYPIKDLGNGSTTYYHLMVEAIKQAMLQRNRELRDPERNNWNYHSSLDPFTIDQNQALPWKEPGQPADTIWMAATDKEGRTACLMQSLFHDFGSGCMIGDTGILWQNRAAGFNPHSTHPNAWAPGRRPAHTLNPSCYLAGNGHQLFFGSQGGDGQPQTQLVLATQLVDFQQNIEEALNAPRFLLGRSFFDSTDNLKLEANIAPHVQSQLAQLGHDIEIIPALSTYTGQAGIISVHDQASAMHDPRGQGNAIAL